MLSHPPIRQPVRLADRPGAMLQRPGEAAPLYRVRFDETCGLIRGEARGCWSVAETRRYIADLDAFVVGSRMTIGKVRVLLDRREVGAQSPEVAALLADANRAIFRGDDRIALVVGTSLMKVSLRQRMPHAGTKAFLSIDAAETWLRA